MSKPREKLLITGATGFIGQALCKALTAKDFEVQVLMRDLTKFQNIPIELRASMVLGSLDNETELALACVGVEQIVHLASIAHVRSNKQDLHKTIVDGTRNLVNAAIKAGVSRVIFVSSSLAVAAEAEAGDITHYGETKLSAERLLQEVADKGLIEVAILRPVNVYGQCMKGNIARMIELIDKGYLPLLPLIKNRISLISADDLAQAIVTLLGADYVPTTAMAVTDGEEYSIEEIENSIYVSLGKSKPSWRIPSLLLYCAAATVGLLSHVTGRGSINVRTYRNLISNNVFMTDERLVELGYVPKRTFYESLPEIISASRYRN